MDLARDPSLLAPTSCGDAPCFTHVSPSFLFGLSPEFEMGRFHRYRTNGYIAFFRNSSTKAAASGRGGRELHEYN